MRSGTKKLMSGLLAIRKQRALRSGRTFAPRGQVAGELRRLRKGVGNAAARRAVKSEG